MMLARSANELWVAANVLRWKRFRQALRSPGEAQRRLLGSLVQRNAASDFGRRHCFASIDSVESFRRHVPLSTYDDYTPWIERIQSGERAVLTAEPVRRLVPSSGSSGAHKLIPYTDRLLREYDRAIGPWVVDLYRAHPELKRGPAYWSISPIEPVETGRNSAVPIGFDDDAGYLGGVFRHVVGRVMAVPSSVRRIAGIEAFRYVTLRWLLAQRELRLISVWHPSFLSLLVGSLAGSWQHLIADVEQGTLSPPVPIEPALHAELCRGLSADPARAEALREAGPVPERIWPRLEVISCWADGHAAEPAAGLRQLFPKTAFQAKGLIASECFVSLPFRGRRPLAVCSHVYEFVDDRGRPHLADELRAGAEYSVVVTTGGGLYRYRLGDRVRVDGFLDATPSLRFLGRDDRVSDRFGEKLSDAFVSSVLRDLIEPLRSRVTFAMLAPDAHDGRIGYTLFLEAAEDLPIDLPERLEQALSRSYHYRNCVRLGQLDPARVFRIGRDAYRTYVEACRDNGQRIGDVKPIALSTEMFWRSRFVGRGLERHDQPAIVEGRR